VPYKVFLVEDEITTREGIRSNVDWQSAGFELCGEASDGEVALPQIEAAQPDVLITDIKMPFMDGLQLSKIIREHMAWMKIIIISGYDDFQYAQTAIKLGVTEYMLKPVSVQDMHSLLAKIRVSLDREKEERSYLKRLNSQVEDNLSLMREKFLLRLVTGGESSLSAVEQSQQLGLNILSPYYQVILLEINLNGNDQVLDYPAYQQIENIISGLTANNPDILLTKKGMETFLLILKGENQEQLEQEGPFIARLLQDEVENCTSHKIVIGVGTPQQRLGSLHHSYAEALAQIKDPKKAIDPELKKINHAALRNFLEMQREEDIEVYFEQAIRSLGEAAIRSDLLKHYILIDVSMTIAQYISDLGGDASQLNIQKFHDDAYLGKLISLEDIRSEIRKMLSLALRLRDSQAGNDRKSIIQKAKSYIDSHFSDSHLSLNEVAAQVNFSPNHFSAVFSEVTGINFRDYLVDTRISHAKRLLQTTRLKCSEVAYQCGYNDPHYFSIIFRKISGQTPQQFRIMNKK
jgi:two-component system, response regulator YesN